MSVILLSMIGIDDPLPLGSSDWHCFFSFASKAYQMKAYLSRNTVMSFFLFFLTSYDAGSLFPKVSHFTKRDQ